VDSQGFRIDSALLTERTSGAIIRPAFQFPTGAMLSPARARELLDWSKRTGGLVFEDAVESEFSYSKRDFRSLATMEASVVLHFNSFSRTLFPSVEVGYLVVPECLVDAFNRARTEVEINVPTASQIVLAEFIAAGHFAKHIRVCRDAAAERHAVLLEALAKFASPLSIDRQYGGLHVCARLAAGASDTAVVAHANSVGIDVAPLSVLYLRKPAAHGLVLGFAAFAPPLIVDAVRAFGSAMSAHRSESSIM
jgi:GntR family transcriptional regulator/MocR family aminotransferase